jgi:hypothetical protein
MNCITSSVPTRKFRDLPTVWRQSSLQKPSDVSPAFKNRLTASDGTETHSLGGDWCLQKQILALRFDIMFSFIP